MKSKSNFTLIEFLIVISIIVVLSSIIYLGTSGARAVARDKQRMADLASYQIALQEYYADYKTFPHTDTVSECNNHQDCSYIDSLCNCKASEYLTALTTKDLINTLPTDPSADENQHYRYVFPLNGKEYKLYVHLEKDEDKMKTDGGGQAGRDVYEVFSFSGSHIAIIYPLSLIIDTPVPFFCDVRSPDSCETEGGIIAMRMENNINARAELPDPPAGPNYNNWCVCCFGPPDLSNDCSVPNKEVFLKLNDTTNALVQKTSFSPALKQDEFQNRFLASYTWTQTTQDDFEQGILKQVDTWTSPGDVVLDKMPQCVDGDLLIDNNVLTTDFPENFSVGEEEVTALKEEYFFCNVEIINGGVFTSQQEKLLQIYAYSIYVDEASSIDVSGKGHIAGQGPGKGGEGSCCQYYAGSHFCSTSTACAGGGGGGYGGIGGMGGRPRSCGCSSGARGSVYGNISSEDLELGSGGGEGGGCNGLDNGYGSGGGAVLLEASHINIEGAVTAKGEKGKNSKKGRTSCNSWCCWYFDYGANGGGSGGTIILKGNSIIVVGESNASGGNGGRYPGGGGGGGGRVKIFYDTTLEDPTADYSVRGGIYGGGSWDYGNGKEGTLYKNEINYIPTIPPSADYFPDGTLASAVLDTTLQANSISWTNTLPSGTDISFEMRASDTLFTRASSTPAWQDMGNSGDIAPITTGIPSGRYVQWRANLTTADNQKTPVLHSVDVTYYTNDPPVITLVTDTPDPIETGQQITFDVEWTDDSPPGDQGTIHICKEDSIDAATKTCDGPLGSWCDNSVPSDSPSFCNYTTQDTDKGINDYYAFACDNYNLCSNSFLGSFTVYEKYSFDVCLSADPGRVITCTYRENSCNADEATLCSISADNEALTEDPMENNFTTRVCCKLE